MRAIRLLEPGKPLKMKGNRYSPARSGRCVHPRRGGGDLPFGCALPFRHDQNWPSAGMLGHEIAGIVEEIGSRVSTCKVGDRVCVHYLVSCGQCHQCHRGGRQFCRSGQMIGKHRDGGMAEYICVPERSAVRLPVEIPIDHGAVMMCSSSTSLHALRKARVQGGETVAIFGIGGLGASAVQLARALGALQVFAVDINPKKLELAKDWGATPINAAAVDPVREIRRLTEGRGVDVSVEVIGLPLTMRQAVQSLAVQGRAAIAGLSGRTFEIASYGESPLPGG